eukprot:scaffold66518_cov14-Tisochrysis_lutea.AAC.1
MLARGWMLGSRAAHWCLGAGCCCTYNRSAARCRARSCGSAHSRSAKANSGAKMVGASWAKPSRMRSTSLSSRGAVCMMNPPCCWKLV